MTALAVGIADTILCLAFNLLWRKEGTIGFFSSDFINVSSIIFGINILFIVIGVVYFGFLQARVTGEVLFSIIFAALTVIGVIAAMHAHRSPDPGQNARFHVLLTGVILICGASAAIGLPLLYHSRKFGKHIL
jgi:H+/gluconate symporter-like permease